MMQQTNIAHKRLARLQRQILMAIKADVRKVLGPQSKDIRRYYEAYKREFRQPYKASSKEELIAVATKSNLILMGDYHTFAQSQKAVLRLLRELIKSAPKLILALEMVPSSHQKILDAYIENNITEDEFLKQINYESNWGFEWEPFKALLNFAKENHYKVFGLNLLDEKKLNLRDTHAAQVLADLCEKYPEYKIFSLYGDLHLARGHIPKFLKTELKNRAIHYRILTIFQNSEALYWKLSEQKMEHTIDVLRLSRNRYCIMNAAPWVKLQSYLQWAEASTLLDSTSTNEEINLHEVAHDRLKNLTQALNLTLPPQVDFTVQTINDLSFLNTSSSIAQLSRPELKAIKYHILNNRTIFVPKNHLIYLASSSVNELCEGVTQLIHSITANINHVFWDPKEHFFAATIHAAVSYFGSKILNHKRKCDLENDFRFLLKIPLNKKALAPERLQRHAAKLILKHCHAQHDYVNQHHYRVPLDIKGPSRIPIFLETVKRVGAILGEKLYISFISGKYPLEKIETLFKAKLDHVHQTRNLYLQLVTELERIPLTHTSKFDLL